MNITELFVKGSDNEITLTLTENDVAIASAWNALDIYIGDPAVVTITRAVNGNGITFASGILRIVPGRLTESLIALVVGRIYPVTIRVKDPTYTVGVYFGAEDSVNQLFLSISDPPG